MNQPVVEPFNQKLRINVLRLGALVFVPLLFLTRPYVAEEGLAFEIMEIFGLFLIVTCVLGRFWAILYIGMQKNRGVVADGPYSMTRNPLYFFSTLGSFGIGLLFGKLLLALLLAALVFLVLYRTARHEQAFLEATFGREYSDYAAHVPVFLPDPRIFRTERMLLISTDAIRRNLLDAFVFLSAIPLAELADALYRQFSLPLLLP